MAATRRLAREEVEHVMASVNGTIGGIMAVDLVNEIRAAWADVDLLLPFAMPVAGDLWGTHLYWCRECRRAGKWSGEKGEGRRAEIQHRRGCRVGELFAARPAP